MSIEVYIDKDKIQDKVKSLADQINKDYQNKEIYIILVLNGSFIFAADLVRQVSCPIIMDFITLSSYGDKKESSGKVNLKYEFKKNLESKNVLIIEDIVDTGLTMKYLIELIEKQNPKSVKIASLLLKASALKHPIKIDYLGFEIQNQFVIGYGLDYAGKYRQLPFIGIYNED